jgi:hypothetical protein
MQELMHSDAPTCDKFMNMYGKVIFKPKSTQNSLKLFGTENFTLKRLTSYPQSTASDYSFHVLNSSSIHEVVN